MTTENASLPSFLDERKSLACIHCGLCLSSCPTYLETGNENDSPRGRIYLMRAVQAGRIPLEGPAVRHIDRCLGCRACEAACPSGVDYGYLLEHTREHIDTRYRRPLHQRLLRSLFINRVFPFPSRLRLALLPVRLIRLLRIESALPKFLRDTLALVPSESPPGAKGSGPDVTPTSRTDRNTPGRVGFIQGCVMSVLFRETNRASVALLNRAGYDVVTPRTQICCGALYAHGGRLEQARESARTNIQAFSGHNLDAVIINAAGCGSTLKEYGALLANDPVWAERARQFSDKVHDLTEWLAERAGSAPEVSRGNSQAPADSHRARVTYHDACHLAHPQGVTRQPRDLIRAVAGDRFMEMAESDVCCGSAGSYNLTEPEMAERLQKRKIGNILKTNAEIVVTTNPGCLLQIRAGLAKAGAEHIRVLHIADYLLESDICADV